VRMHFVTFRVVMPRHGTLSSRKPKLTRRPVFVGSVVSSGQAYVLVMVGYCSLVRRVLEAVLGEHKQAAPVDLRMNS